MTSEVGRLRHHFAGPEAGQITIDLSANSWLADHTVRGVAVVPGSLYVEAMASEHIDQPAFALEQIEFHVLAPLTQRPLQFTTSMDGSSLEMHQQGSEGSTDIVVKALRSEDLSVAEVPAVEDNGLLGATAIYDQLRAAGNDYGTAFRGLTSASRSGNLTEASWALNPATGDEYRIHPLLLDLTAHALGLTAAEQTRTYLLRRIGRVVITGTPNGTAGRIVTRANPIETDGEKLLGSAWILNQDGTLIAYCEEIELGLLEQSGDVVAEHIAVAATFTVDPVSDVVRFWNNSLDLSLGTKVAPYGQVFQELLDPGSMLATNPGTSAVVVRLEDWTRERNELDTDGPEVDDSFDSYTLPDGRRIASLNDYETRYLEREIFIDEAYARHNITFEDGDVIVDIGANIGMFSLFAAARASNLRIFAYEPSPVVFPILATNLSAHCPGAVPIQAGAGQEAGEADLTFYPRSSVFSGFNADSANDGAALGAIIRNTVVEHLGGTEADVDAVVQDFMADRLEAETHTCRIESVSELIKSYDLDHIDLLKVDAEKSERDILAGIADADWPKIRQMVIEVHDQDGEGIEDVCDLLRERGFELEIEEERLLENSGLYNIFCQRPETTKNSSKTQISDQDRTRVQSLCDDLVDAVEGFVARGSDLTTIFTPPTDSPDQTWFKSLEQDTVDRLRAIKGSNVVGSTELLELYPVADLHDPIGDRLGHVPYRPDFFAALGTSLVRYQQSVRSKPYKVLVLDCDNTLWSGVAGELGPTGVTVSPQNVEIQKRAKGLGQAGVVIALASKNDEATVKSVFAENPDMVLQWDDVVTHRINWDTKASNIAAIAAELDLGLDSFVFIDDNPVEIAEVRSALPQVLSLQLPDGGVGSWLNHIWAFDRRVLTAEDKDRAEMYRQAAARKRELTDAPSLESFIEDLDLVVDIRAADETDLDRMAQLTQRTNQFNFNPKPQTVADLRAMQSTHSLEIVTVTDRFGSYGVVSALIYSIGDDLLTVDTLLLSCRVLGRGVEHEILAHLGRRAQTRGASKVSLPYSATDRNSPALRFASSTAASEQFDGDVTWFVFDAQAVATLKYQPDTLTAASDEVALKLVSTGMAVDSAIIQRATTEFTDMALVATMARDRPRLPRPKLDQAFVGPRDELEADLGELWGQILGFETVGVMDSFFDLGGGSLLAVDMIAQLEAQLGQNLSIVDMYDTPNIEAIAKILRGESSSAKRVEESHDRGSSRRQARAGRPTRRRGR